MKSFLAFFFIWLLTVILVAFSSPGLFYIVSETLFFISRSNPKDLALSTQLLHFPAEHGFLPAQVELGRRYIYGKGVEKDNAHGVKWVTKAAASNDSRAQELLCSIFFYECSEAERPKLLQSIKEAAARNSQPCQRSLSLAYYYGLSTKPDLTRAFVWCKEAADRNKAQSQFQVARYFQYGLGTDTNEKEMFSYDEKAAKQGVTSSQLQLAIDYLNGRAVKQNAQEGLKWLEKAAKHGNCRAQTLLGLIYKFQLFDKNDASLAEQYLAEPVKQKSSTAIYLTRLGGAKSSDGLKQLQAAARSDQHAAAVLAEMYATGCGAKLSLPDAIKWYQIAASKGDSDSQVRLGMLHNNGAVDGKPNFAEAQSLFEKAAVAGNSEGMYYCGRNELSGLGCKLNRDRGRTRLRKAAESGSIEGAVYYSVISQDSDTEKKQALKWLQRAGDKGDVSAQELLVKLDRFDSQKWTELAMEQGCGPIRREFAEQSIVGISEKKDTPGGIKILEELSNAGDGEARLQLAENYRFGLFDVKEDKKRAVELFELEAKRNNASAILKLAEMYRLSELGEAKKGESCKWYEKAAALGSQEGERKLRQYCDNGQLKFFSDDG